MFKKNNLIQSAREAATGGAAKAFLEQLTWDPRSESIKDVEEKHARVFARAAVVGCSDELIELERQVWVNAAKGKR